MNKNSISILLYKYYQPSNMKLYIDINKNYCISYCSGLLDCDYNRYSWFRFNFNLKKIKVIHHIKYDDDYIWDCLEYKDLFDTEYKYILLRKNLISQILKTYYIDQFDLYIKLYYTLTALYLKLNILKKRNKIIKYSLNKLIPMNCILYIIKHL
jgi:hypothetical protein